MSLPLLFLSIPAAPPPPTSTYMHALAPLGGTVVEVTAGGTTVDPTFSVVGNYTSDGTLV